MARSPSRTLQLTYLGDASQLRRTTKDAGNDVRGFGDRIKGFGKVAAAGFAVAGAASLALGRTLFEAFEEASTANARVENLVDQLGNFEGEVSGVTDRLIEQAEATARLTGVDRNLIKESQGLLLTFDNVNKTAGDAGGVFDRATQAAVDLAAAGFGSVDSAANQLGKALEDPQRGLSSLREVGVSFTADQEDLIKSLVESNDVLGAQTIILEAVEGQVGGTAEATANGSDRIRQSFGLLTESVAEQLSPAFEFLVEKALEFVDDFGVWWQENGPDIVQSFKDLGTNVKDTFDRFREFTGEVSDELREQGTYARLKIALQDLKGSFSDLGGAAGDFFDTVAGEESTEKASTFARVLDVLYFRPINALIGRVERAIDVITDLIEFADRVADIVNEIRDDERELFPGLGGSLGPGTLPGSIPDLGPNAFDAIPQAGNRQTGNVTINVTGAIDREGTARTIERVLVDSGRRVGGGQLGFA